MVVSTDWDPTSAYLDRLGIHCDIHCDVTVDHGRTTTMHVGKAAFFFQSSGPATTLTWDNEKAELTTGDLLLLCGNSPRGFAEARHSIGPTAGNYYRQAPAFGHASSPRNPEPTRLIGGAVLSRTGSMQLPAELLPPWLLISRDPATSSLLDVVLDQSLRQSRFDDPGSLAVLNQLFSVLCLEAVRRRMNVAGGVALNWLPALHDAEIGLILANMLRQPERPWTIESLAELADMARSTFARRFLVLTRETPMSVLTEIRMRKACELLRTATPLKEVARACGYRSVSAFTSVFRRQLGQTPRSFRIRSETVSENRYEVGAATNTCGDPDSAKLN